MLQRSATYSSRLPAGAGSAFVLAILVHTGSAVGLAFVPLFDLLGYEFSVVTSLLASLFAGPVAIGVAYRLDGWGRQLRRSLGLNLLSMLPALLMISTNALRVPNCNFSTGLAFYALLGLGSMLLSTLWGLSLAWVLPRRPWPGLAYACLWFGLAGLALARVWTGVEVDSFNPLLGWVAGPIYDAVIEPGQALMFSRLHSLAWTLTLLCLALMFSRPKPAAKAAQPPIGKLVFGGLFALSIALGLGAQADRLGFGRSPDAIEAALPVMLHSRHFIIRCPENLDAEQRRLLLADHEFRLQQIKRQLGDLDLPPIRSYVFSSAADKRRMVGAGRTQYAKPWQPMLSLNMAGFPHPSLKHELVHVAASAIGSWPTATSASSGLWINMGLTEGLAVALDWGSGEEDPHTWSAALRRIGKAPPIAELFNPVGFWSSAANRSYTLAGSFVRYLLDTYGARPLVAAYRSGSLEGHYPAPVEDLIGEWESFLDALDLDENVLAKARSRFARGGVFQQVCAHEQAKLRAEASHLIAGKHWREAQTAIDQLLEHLPDDPHIELLRMEMLRRQKKLGEARDLGWSLMRHEGLGEADRANLAGRLGDLAAGLGDLPAARRGYFQQLGAHLSESSDRSALIKLQAMDHLAGGQLACSLAGGQVLEFLADGSLDLGAFHDLMQAALLCPTWSSAHYLLGRQLFNRDHFDQAVIWLQQADRVGLASPALRRENRRLLVQTLFRLGRKSEALAEARELEDQARHPSQTRWSLDWIERLEFDDQSPDGFLSQADGAAKN